MEGYTSIYAHRGSKGTHPENTLVAFQDALQLGVDGLEFDVHLTKDHELVIIHDETVDRTTNGSGYIKDMTLKEIKKLDAGSKFSKEFKGEPIPTLQEVLELAKNYPNVCLNIEIKTDYVQYEGIEEKIVEVLQKTNVPNKIIFSSFNHYSLVKVKKLVPHIETAILFFEGLYEPWSYARNIGASALHMYEPIALSPLVEMAHEVPFPVRIFTVNKKERMKNFMERKVDAIMTDFPKKALDIRKKIYG